MPRHIPLFFVIVRVSAITLPLSLASSSQHIFTIASTISYFFYSFIHFSPMNKPTLAKKQDPEKNPRRAIFPDQRAKMSARVCPYARRLLLQGGKNENNGDCSGHSWNDNTGHSIILSFVKFSNNTPLVLVSFVRII